MTKPPCEACPVRPGVCLGATGDRPHFCAWALTGERSKLGLIVDRSALPLEPPPPSPPPPAAVVPLPAHRLRSAAASCPYRERCGCEAPKCHDPDFGPRFGRADLLGVTRVTLDQCVACVSALNRGLPAPRG